MFFEYAIEPSVLSSWDRARFYLDAFGPWKGRFLAEYPRKWKRLVFDALSCSDVEKKRIVERLSQLDRRVFSPRAGAPYDGQIQWLENAIVEHRRSPFRAIIACTVSQLPDVLDGADVDDRHERWRVESGCCMARDPAVLVKALELLLKASKRVVIIDPYFRADHDDKTRPLVAICRAVVGIATVEVHFADAPRGYEISMRDASRALPALLPGRMKVGLYCWKEKFGGPRLHNRYLLTDIGGVQFGDGVELGDGGQEDRISIVDETSRLKLWNQYLGTPTAFEAAGCPREFGAKFVAQREH